MTKKEEMIDAMEQFCIREYGRSQKKRMTGSDFTLYAVDCGGYDITSEAVLKCENGELTLIVHTKLDNDYMPVETEEFKLVVVEK